MKKILFKIKDEWLFYGTFTLFILVLLATQRLPEYSKSDIEVLILLASFMIIINGFENAGLFLKIKEKIGSRKLLPLKLILISSLLGVFLTNNIALITVVPLTLTLNLSTLKKFLHLRQFQSMSSQL